MLPLITLWATVDVWGKPLNIILQSITSSIILHQPKLPLFTQTTLFSISLWNKMICSECSEEKTTSCLQTKNFNLFRRKSQAINLKEAYSSTKAQNKILWRFKEEISSRKEDLWAKNCKIRTTKGNKMKRSTWSGGWSYRNGWIYQRYVSFDNRCNF